MKLNGVLLQGIHLSEHPESILRHNGEEAVTLNKRPLCGHIGYQD